LPIKLHRIAAVSTAAFVSIVGFSHLARAQQTFEQRYPFPPGAYGFTQEGEVKINVTPNEAAVYVDGFYAGRVDDFDGPFQRLHAPVGDREIVIYLQGYRLLRQRLNVSFRSTGRITGTLEKLGPGESDPGPPAAAELPATGPAGSPSGLPSSPAGPRGTTRAGLLAIRVQPGDAELFIDGERWEASPGDQRLLVEVSEGRHVVEIRMSGYRPFSTEVVVRPRQTTPLNVSLTKE
jgi:hypothetical protein